MQVWNVLRVARWKYRTQKIAKKSPSGHHPTTLSGYISIMVCVWKKWREIRSLMSITRLPRLFLIYRVTADGTDAAFCMQFVQCQNPYLWNTATTAIVLWPLYRTTCISRHRIKKWKIMLEQSFTVHMPLLMSTCAFGLVRRCTSSPQCCYPHCLHTS